MISIHTFTNVTLPHETPKQVSAVVTIRRFVKSLLDEAVSMLVGKVVVPHGARRTSAWASPSGTTYTVCAALGSHGVVRSIPPFLNFEVSG